MTPMINTCSPRTVKEFLDAGRPCRLVDVREPAEYAAGHVPGAELIPLGTLPGRASSFDRSRPIVLLCKSGRRAGKAAEILKAAGCDEIIHVQGGTDAWIAEGLPVDREPAAPWTVERQVRLIAGLLVIIGLFIPPWPYLSAVVGAGLVVAAVFDCCAMSAIVAALRPDHGAPGCADGRCPPSSPNAKNL